MIEKKAPPRKRAPRKIPDVEAPPLDAVDTPPAPKPRRRNAKAAGHRRGATAPPGPADLVKQREREWIAVELATAGVNDWDEIARAAGYSDRSAAWKAVQRVLNRQEFARVADYRALIGQRYERIIRANWEPAITAEESPAKEKATSRVLKAMEGLRRAFGLDLEAERLADAFRIPESEQERLADLQNLREGLRVVGGTDVE